MTNKLPTTERRFREGTGVRYLIDGRIRCHALSKGALRKYREECNDYDSPAEDLWPECQCNKAAEAGAFACRWHGGMTPKVNSESPRSILDVMPLDLAEKMKMLMDDPQYLNRREDILLLKARVLELLDDLNAAAGGEEAWGYVAEAKVALSKGREEEALMLLEESLKHADKRKEIWSEIRKNELVVKELTNTQVRTAEKLQQMATTEQVMATITSIYEFVLNESKKYIHDATDRSMFYKGLSAAIYRYANLSPETVSRQIESGRDGGIGDSEYVDN